MNRGGIGGGLDVSIERDIEDWYSANPAGGRSLEWLAVLPLNRLGRRGVVITPLSLVLYLFPSHLLSPALSLSVTPLIPCNIPASLTLSIFLFTHYPPFFLYSSSQGSLYSFLSLPLSLHLLFPQALSIQPPIPSSLSLFLAPLSLSLSPSLPLSLWTSVFRLKWQYINVNIKINMNKYL